MEDEPDPVLSEALAAAFARFHANLNEALPQTATHIQKWLHGVPTRPDHALGARAFPHLLLPYWLSPPEERAVDLGFQTDVLYSSIIGYYAIRLCDNIADGDGGIELSKLAPCTLFFDSQAMRIYMKYFSVGHGFWPLFDVVCAQQAEASAADSFLTDIDASTFARLSARKFTGAKIPASAALYRYLGPEAAVEPWLDFIDRLGDFAQFSNDFFDWRRDAINGIVTYFSSEARRRAPDDDLTSWVLRDGFNWGAAELKARFQTVRTLAADLGNKEVLNWTETRGRRLDADIQKLGSGLELMRTFSRVIWKQTI